MSVFLDLLTPDCTFGFDNLRPRGFGSDWIFLLPCRLIRNRAAIRLLKMSPSTIAHVRPFASSAYQRWGLIHLLILGGKEIDHRQLQKGISNVTIVNRELVQLRKARG
jgi:hypothetical protein